MITSPRPLTAAEVLLLCLSAACVAALFLRAQRRSLPTLVAVSLLASVAAIAPFEAWAVVKNARASRALSTFAADRFGPESNGIDTTVLDRAARRIPKHATYVIALSPRANAAAADVFADWAQAELLPRIRVADPGAARWVITFGASPRQLGISASAVRFIASKRDSRLGAWVGMMR